LARKRDTIDPFVGQAAYTRPGATVGTGFPGGEHAGGVGGDAGLESQKTRLVVDVAGGCIDSEVAEGDDREAEEEEEVKGRGRKRELHVGLWGLEMDFTGRIEEEHGLLYSL
jgi:hypothetical protein